MADECINASFPKSNQAGIEFVISTTKELQENIMFLSNDFPIAMFTQSYRHATSDHIPFHWHDGLQISWVSEGELEHCINGDTFRLAGDKLLFINSHQLHSSKTIHQDTKTLCINFSPEIFQPQILKNLILPLLENPSFPYTLLPLKPYQTELLKKYLNWKNEPLGYFSVMNFLSQVFEIMLNEFEENKDPSNYEEMRLFHAVLEYVHSQYSEQLTVKQIADHVLINKNHLTGLFNKYTNMSPLKYLNDYRLYIAKNIIIHTDKSISDISADVGYNQISHFIKQFRKSYGLSPLKYRNKYGEKQNLPKVR